MITMRKAVHVSYETGYNKEASLDYFHDGTDHKFEDESKFKIVSTKHKEITDDEDKTKGIQDWEWKVEVFVYSP
jgi:hypothetical protein